MINTKNEIIAIPLLLIAGAIAGYFIGSFAEKSIKKILPPMPIVQPKEVRAGGYEFINPLLECDNFTPIKGGTLVNLESELRTYIEQALHDKRAEHISISFRDLNNGPGIGINENEKYSPASLLKVPVAIAAMKRAEVDPYFLKKLVRYDNPQATKAMPNMNDTVYLKIGKAYSIEKLIEYMVVGSDNEAMMLVLNNTGENLISKVMSDLGIKKEGSTGSKSDFVSVKDYSSMFRFLYNATYLEKDMSEKLLSVMTKSNYTEGIVAGIPAGIKVSHKFGERAFENSSVRQLHDCGIVYIPGTPYLLCVMTRGDDFSKLKTVISDISAMVYTKMSKAKHAEN